MQVKAYVRIHNSFVQFLYFVFTIFKILVQFVLAFCLLIVSKSGADGASG